MIINTTRENPKWGVHSSPTSACFAKTTGMTLVEIIASLAILVLVLAGVLTAFGAATNISKETRIKADDSATVESQIAGETAAEPVNQEDAPLKLGDFTLLSAAVTYQQGSRTYTVLEAAEPPAPEPLYFGDGANGITAAGKKYQTTAAGGSMSYTVTASGMYRLEVWGALGSGNMKAENFKGGKGGYSVGTVSLSAGTILQLNAGGVGTAGTVVGTVVIIADGGFNGGGRAAEPSGKIGSTAPGSGGGASDIRIGGVSLYHRVIVAGGGGGAGINYGDNCNDFGGAGGGSVGANGQSVDGFGVVSDNPKYRGAGGSQTAGGATGTSGGDSANGPGRFGQGGYTSGSPKYGGGGGGGWYGGGSGSYAGAGGGSGWIFNATNLSAWNAAHLINTDPTDDEAWQLSSSYYLAADAKTVDGGTTTNIPNPLDPSYDPSTFDPNNSTTWGASITGNSRGGFVRITFLG
jgi:type II secretory pathway pseudopilin PulG